MKKILIVFIFLFILSSCGEDNIIIKDKENIEKEEVVSEIVQEKVTVQEENNNGELIVDALLDNKITFSVLEKNFIKLKDVEIESMEMEMLNNQFVDFYNNRIIYKAISEKSAKLCDKLDNNFINNCKKEVFIKSGNVENCDNFTDTGSVIDCKREFYNVLAYDEIDEKICDKIIDNSEDKNDIRNCKDRVFTKKAIENLDKKICESIENKNEINMCVEMVKMEEQTKKTEDEMKKRMNEEIKKIQ